MHRRERGRTLMMEQGHCWRNKKKASHLPKNQLSIGGREREDGEMWSGHQYHNK
jgi:hypothetical protein